MYDAGLTGLIMIPLAPTMSLLLCEPGCAGYFTKCPHVNRLPDRSSTRQGESSRSEPIVLLRRASAWPGLLWMHVWAAATTSWGNSKASVAPCKSPKEREAGPEFHRLYSQQMS